MAHPASTAVGRRAFQSQARIAWEEHQRVLSGKGNPELRAYYELLWQLDGSQTDMAALNAQDIDWEAKTISYARQKTGICAIVHFGDTMAGILRACPNNGFFSPMIARWNESDRASIFSRRCHSVGIGGVTLHSYWYAWVERARKCGCPERFAQEAVRHNSKAVHRAYARGAQVTHPSLEQYESSSVGQNVIPLQLQQGAAAPRR